jgi:hypothetical protein
MGCWHSDFGSLISEVDKDLDNYEHASKELQKNTDINDPKQNKIAAESSHEIQKLASNFESKFNKLNSCLVGWREHPTYLEKEQKVRASAERMNKISDEIDVTVAEIKAKKEATVTEAKK